MKKFLYIVIFSILLLQLCCAQNLDSLWKVYNDKSQVDTNRLNALHSIAWFYSNNNPDTAIILADQEFKLAQQTKQKKHEGNALTIMGLSYMNKGNYPKALDNYLKSLKKAEEIGNKKGEAGCYNNIGLIYENQANYPKALECYLKSLKLYQEINYKKGVAGCYGNIGLIYEHQSNLSKSLEYHFKSLKLYQEIDNKKGITGCYRNIGNYYADAFNYSKALEYYLEDLKICKETDDKQEAGGCYGNIGELYNDMANYKKAIQYCDSALQKTKETGDIDAERTAYQNIALAYSKTGKYKEAYEAHIKFKTLTDSIFNEDNSKQLGDLKTQFEVEKKEAELKIKSDAEQEKLKAIASEETKRQKVVIASVAGVLLVVIVFSLFLYKRFRIAQKQKEVIEEQKVLVDKAYEELHEKNKEVMDSILYAKRIQTALITSEKYIESSLNKLMQR
jgi:tetratricopeptide (TPR) repeat protein